MAFSYNPSEQFHANIGVPFQITYRPTEQWLFEVSYLPIRTIHAKASYRFTPWLSAFVGYDWAAEVYALRDRPDDDDRFFMYDQRAATGLETSLGQFVSIVVQGGYAFDRFSFEGSQWDTTESNRINFGDGPFASLGISLRR